MKVETPAANPQVSGGRSARTAALLDRFPRARPMLLLVSAVLLLNVLTVRIVENVSAVDEREHIDYLIRGARGEMGQGGEKLTQEALHEFCRRGSEIFVWPPCRPGRLDPTEFSVGGINVDSNRPFYSWATGLPARALRAVTPGPESLVTGGRLLGSLWLLVGCYLTLRAGELLGVPRWALLLALLMAAAVPAQLHAATTINPDATAFATGAAVVLAALAWEVRRKGLWLLLLASAIGTLLDESNGVVALVVLAYLVFRGFGAARGRVGDAPSWRQYAVAGALVILAAGAATAGWDRVQDGIQDPPPARNQVDYDEAYAEDRATLDPTRVYQGEGGLKVEEVFSAREVFGMFPPAIDVAPPERRMSTFNATWYQLFTTAAVFAMTTAIIVGAFKATFTDRLSALGLATLFGLLTAPPLLHVYDYLRNGSFELVVPRFGLSALPAVMLLVAGAGPEKLTRWTLVVLAGGLYLSALITLT